MPITTNAREKNATTNIRKVITRNRDRKRRFGRFYYCLFQLSNRNIKAAMNYTHIRAWHHNYFLFARAPWYSYI